MRIYIQEKRMSIQQETLSISLSAGDEIHLGETDLLLTHEDGELISAQINGIPLDTATVSVIISACQFIYQEASSKALG